ncbi:nicotinate-nucleotide adenylyltransferase [Mycoplasma phocoenae]|uniref:Probable nicotinate-nucleotide adenylyltransferase n=1 Tax=Mycoplasma phocoenae TaxID=754517 RepID=A0A858U3V3_9MOLU|nr:nicotinate-nucleotide adenylyltransferase [Mycoplasma phocoenae]QJG67150.1 nicotinate-nucleotide adenylyltransferase [Mycoplasma phocoenae]
MKIAIYGGTFDPVTKGHIKVARFAIETLNLDKLIFVPANINPFKTQQKSESAVDRLNMIKIVLEDKMEVSDFEIKRNGPSYTIETIKHFKNKYPNDELFLLIGSDNLVKINKWHSIDEFNNYVKIKCFKRTPNINKINAKKYNIEILKNPLFPYSSTNFRNGQINCVDQRVMEYIGDKFLYIEEIIKNTVSHERYKHMKYAADYAVELATLLNYPKKWAYYAALMHDITKEYSTEKHLALIKKYYDSKLFVPTYKMHQLSAYVFLKHLYKVNNTFILEAIKCHTSLKDNLSTLEKILYVADKLCKGRAWPGIQAQRNLFLKDFDLGFKSLVKSIHEFLISDGKEIEPEQINVYQKWSK